MKGVTLLAILGISIVFIGCTNMQSSKVMLRISKEELKAKLGSPDLVPLDVRATNNWEQSDEKIAGAQRVNPESIDTWAATLPKGKEIVLYCA
jgi:rhodanese-related sulfurtransferase